LELCAFDLKILNSAVTQEKLQSKVNEQLGKLQERFTDRFIVLLSRLLSLDPAKRPDIEQIKDELEKSLGESLVKTVWYIEIYDLIE